jgi:hypothetical protein
MAWLVHEHGDRTSWLDNTLPPKRAPNISTKARTLMQRLNSLFPLFSLMVIVMSMGSAKKKPMTKKEREEKRRKHKEKRLKK